MVRIKNRYFVVELVTQDTSRSFSSLHIRHDELNAAIRRSLLEIHGEFGWALASLGLQVSYCNAITRVAIVRCLRVHQSLLATALACVTIVSQRDVTLRTIYKGATLMHCYKFLKRHQEKCLERLWQRCDSTSERQNLRSQIMSFTVINCQQARDIHAASVCDVTGQCVTSHS